MTVSMSYKAFRALIAVVKECQTFLSSLEDNPPKTTAEDARKLRDKLQRKLEDLDV